MTFPAAYIPLINQANRSIITVKCWSSKNYRID